MKKRAAAQQRTTQLCSSFLFRGRKFHVSGSRIPEEGASI
jgi:hypothetical protein